VAAHRDRSIAIAGGGALPPGLRKQLQVVPRGGNGLQGPNGKGGAGANGNQLGPLLRGRLGALGGLAGTVQHGEFTVQDATGTTAVMTFQRGTVTASSSISVTVKSSDSFSATYTIDSSTRGPGTTLANGDTVVVVAQKTGSKAVLIRVIRGG
jgi:hypothetical protein